MRDVQPLPRRRRLLGMLAGLPLAGLPLQRASATLHDPETALSGPAPASREGTSILVAGPHGGELDRWSRVLAPTLARSLQTNGSTHVAGAGGVDGVTGANQFDARTAPDGSTALLVPGAAALAWLAGDPRAQFDAAHWVPVLAGVTPALVAGRVAPAALTPGSRVRIAAASPSGPDMAALLAVELLGPETVPVFGLADPDAIRDAFARREVDLVFLHGRQVPERLAALRADGAQPLFSLAAPGDDTGPMRDPLFPDVPRMVELYRDLRGARPSGPLYEAWLAAAAGARLDFGLVLPQLSPAPMVALWRRAGAQVVAGPELQAAATAAAVQPLAGLGAAASITGVAADDAALLALRRWLATRFNWRPV